MSRLHTRTLKTTAILLSTLTLGTQLANAASIDFRHEYRDKSGQHASRLKLNESFDNGIYFSTELKFKGYDGKFMKDLQINGSEFDVGYRHSLGGGWVLQPGMPIEFGTNSVTYKPQLRLTYNFDSGLSLSGRYRYDIRQNSLPESDNTRRHRLTANVNYRLNDWQFGFETNYYKADGYDLYKGKETNYEHNLTARYNMGSWSPYIEFGNINYNDSTVADGSNDKRELRSRVGISYSF